MTVTLLYSVLQQTGVHLLLFEPNVAILYILLKFRAKFAFRLSLNTSPAMWQAVVPFGIFL